MSNVFNTVKVNAGIVAKAAAMALSDELQFCKSIAKADESDFDGKNGYSAGDTIYISKPARFIPGTAFDITSAIQDVTEEKVALTLDTISTVGVQINSLELATTFQLKGLINRVVKPAVQSIAQDIENRLLLKAVNATYNSVGTAGSSTFDPDLILSAREKLHKFLAPKDDNRFFLHDSTQGRLAVGARKGLFQASTAIAEQYKMGYVGQADGFNWLESELIPVHTRGTEVGTAGTLSGTAAEAASVMSLTGTSGGTLLKGDIITVAGVYAVHPITKTTYPFLQQFVVTANNTAVSTAYTAVPVSPAFYTATSTSLQNISRLPTSGDVFTVVGNISTGYSQGLAYHKNAFRMVSAPLVMPTAVEFAAQETYQGITVAVIRAFDVLQRRMITRMDVLCGLAADRPEWSCRLTS